MGRKSKVIIEDIEEIIDLLEIDGYSNIVSTLKEAIQEIESSELEVQRYKDLLALYCHNK